MCADFVCLFQQNSEHHLTRFSNIMKNVACHLGTHRISRDYGRFENNYQPNEQYHRYEQDEIQSTCSLFLTRDDFSSSLQDEHHLVNIRIIALDVGRKKCHVRGCLIIRVWSVWSKKSILVIWAKKPNDNLMALR